jgi:hypothetical protein
MERHEKETRIKKIIRAFTLFLVLLITVMLIIIVVRVERRSTKKNVETGYLIRKIIDQSS